MAEHRQTSLAAALFVVCGVGGSIVLFLHPENMDGPVWLGHAASGAFVLAGLAAFCKQHGLRSAFDWLVLAMLVCLFAIGAWVAFGPGFIGFDTGGFVCLSAFGLGASLIGAVAFWQFIRIVRGQSSA